VNISSPQFCITQQLSAVVCCLSHKTRTLVCLYFPYAADEAGIRHCVPTILEIAFPRRLEDVIPTHLSDEAFAVHKKGIVCAIRRDGDGESRHEKPRDVSVRLDLVRNRPRERKSSRIPRAHP